MISLNSPVTLWSLTWDNFLTSTHPVSFTMQTTVPLFSFSYHHSSHQTHLFVCAQIVLTSLALSTLWCTDSTNDLSRTNYCHAHAPKLLNFTYSHWFQQGWLHPSITDGDAPFWFYFKRCYANSIAYSLTLRRYGFSRYNEKCLASGDSLLIKVESSWRLQLPKLLSSAYSLPISS